MQRHRSHFLLGGARSGKSRRAVTIACDEKRPTAFVATGEAFDDGMRAHIARHRAERPADWLTVEEPLALPAACRALPATIELVVVDCLTVWVGNRIVSGDDDDAILADAAELARLLAERRRSWVIVSNEVGEGVHPPTADGMRFRDALGLVNQRIAAAADYVALMVAGLPLVVKDGRATATNPRAPHPR